MNVKEAAARLNVHTQTIYNMLYDGRIEATKTKSGSWDIAEETIQEIRKQLLEEKELENSISLGAFYINKQIKEDEKEFLENLYINAEMFVESYKNDAKTSEINRLIEAMKTAIDYYESLNSVKDYLVRVESETLRSK